MSVLLISIALLSPLAAIACFLARDPRRSVRISIAASAAMLLLSLALAALVLRDGAATAPGGWLLADALSALIVCVLAVVGLAAAWYGAWYMPNAAEKMEAKWIAHHYHALFQALMGSIFAAAIANNLGLLWIAIETSTLTSALLVGLYPRPGAVEAAWKYLILCSVGIVFALLATVLIYASAVGALGEGTAGLQWTTLREVATQLDPRLLKLGFLFALVGYGTKAGLAPLHTWMPDAHSQAPTPVSAVISAGLLTAALSALFRIHALCARGVGAEWSGGLLVVFGLLSLVVSVPFVLLQGEFKRLLAYSSLENVGFVTLAIGFGAPLAIYGGLFHLVAQSLAKTLAFLLGGTYYLGFGSRRMDHWRGAIVTFPAHATLFAIAGAGLAGLPPTALFLSEWFSFHGGLAAGHTLAVAIAIGSLAAIFAGLAFHWTRIAFGKPSEQAHDPMPALAHAPLWVVAGLLVMLGVWIPSPVRALLEGAAQVLKP